MNGERFWQIMGEEYKLAYEAETSANFEDVAWDELDEADHNFFEGLAKRVSEEMGEVG